MALKRFLMISFVAMLVACGDDDSSDFATRPSGDSSSACEDCDDSSSSKAKSSDSETSVSSSSSAKSSSSSGDTQSVVDPSTVVMGTMTDERDGQTYKTVKIGSQTWMAENLNYAYTNVPYNFSSYLSDSTSWCFRNNPDSCAKYGRLYTWAAAMDSVGEWSTNGKGCGYRSTCTPTYPVRGICPERWHLPEKAEFVKLFDAVGGQSTAAKMLKSSSGWKENKGESGNGTDAYSFAALPAGNRNQQGDFKGVSEYADFWSATDYEGTTAELMNLFNNRDDGMLSYGFNNFGMSVRCVRDE